MGTEHPILKIVDAFTNGVLLDNGYDLDFLDFI